MIEAIPVLFVAAIATASYVSARSYATSTANRSVRADLIRIKAQQAWLASRVQRARREKWETDMLSQLEDQLAAVEVELVAAKHRTEVRFGPMRGQR